MSSELLIGLGLGLRYMQQDILITVTCNTQSPADGTIPATLAPEIPKFPT